MGEKTNIMSIESAEIWKWLSMVTQDDCDEAIELQKIVSERFEDVMNLIQNHPQMSSQIKRCLDLKNPTSKLLALTRGRLLCIIEKNNSAAEKSSKITNESDEQELLERLWTELQWMYSNQWFHKNQVFDFQETAVQFIDALHSFYYPPEDNEDGGFGDLIEKDKDKKKKIGRMLHADDMNNLKNIVSAIQTYFDYIEAGEKQYQKHQR